MSNRQQYQPLFEITPHLNGYQVSQFIISDIATKLYAKIEVPPKMLALENLTSLGEEIIIRRVRYDPPFPIQMSKSLYRQDILPLGLSIIVEDKEKRLTYEQQTFGDNEQPLPFQMSKEQVVHSDPYNRFRIQAKLSLFFLFYNEDANELFYAGRFMLKYVDITPEMGVFIEEPLTKEDSKKKWSLYDVLHQFYVNMHMMKAFDQLYGRIYGYNRKDYIWKPIERSQPSSSKKTTEKWDVLKWIDVSNTDGEFDFHKYSVEWEKYHSKNPKKEEEDARHPYFGLYYRSPSSSPDGSTDPIVVIRLILRRSNVHIILHQFRDISETQSTFLTSNNHIAPLYQMKIEADNFQFLMTSDDVDVENKLTRTYPMQKFCFKHSEIIKNPTHFEEDYLSNDQKQWHYFCEVPTRENLKKKLLNFSESVLRLTPETIRLILTDRWLDYQIRNEYQQKGKNVTTQLFTDGLTRAHKTVADQIRQNFRKRDRHPFDILYDIWNWLLRCMGPVWGLLLARHFFSFEETLCLDERVLKNMIYFPPGTYVYRASRSPFISSGGRNINHNIFSYTMHSEVKIEYEDARLQAYEGEKDTELTKAWEDVELRRSYDALGDRGLKRTIESPFYLDQDHEIIVEEYEVKTTSSSSIFVDKKAPEYVEEKWGHRAVQRVYFLRSGPDTNQSFDCIHTAYDVWKIIVKPLLPVVSSTLKNQSYEITVHQWNGAVTTIKKSISTESSLSVLVSREITTSCFVNTLTPTVPSLNNTEYRHVSPSQFIMFERPSIKK